MLIWCQTFSILWKHTRFIAHNHSVKKARHFFLRSLLHPRISAIWLDFIDEYCSRYNIHPIPLDLIIKLTRTYGSKHLRRMECVERLKMHYNFIASLFPEAIIKQVVEGEPFALVTLVGKSGAMYRLRLRHHQRFRTEGEFTIKLLEEESSVSVSSLTFSIAIIENKPFIWIGGLQGALAMHGKEKIVGITRDLHGLRPKYALLETLYAIAGYINAFEIRAISSQNHPAMGSGKKFVANYNDFWQEVGGIKNKDGNFLLPASLPKRTLQEVPTKKKKDWLKRQEYLTLIVQETHSALEEISAVPNYRRVGRAKIDHLRPTT